MDAVQRRKQGRCIDGVCSIVLLPAPVWVLITKLKLSAPIFFCFVFVNPKMMSKKLDTNQPNHMAKKLDKLKKIGFNAVWKVFVLCFRHSIESLHIYFSASYFYLTSHKQ